MSHRVPLTDVLFRDAAYGMRVLRRNPILAAVAVVPLALGIGANAAINHQPGRRARHQFNRSRV